MTAVSALLVTGPLRSSYFNIVIPNYITACDVDALGDYQKVSGSS
jgi:hypothetical protein